MHGAPSCQGIHCVPWGKKPVQCLYIKIILLCFFEILTSTNGPGPLIIWKNTLSQICSRSIIWIANYSWSIFATCSIKQGNSNMILEQILLKIFFQIINGPGPYCPGPAGPGPLVKGKISKTKQLLLQKKKKKKKEKGNIPSWISIKWIWYMVQKLILYSRIMQSVSKNCSYIVKQNDYPNPKMFSENYISKDNFSII